MQRIHMLTWPVREYTRRLQPELRDMPPLLATKQQSVESYNSVDITVHVEPDSHKSTPDTGHLDDENKKRLQESSKDKRDLFKPERDARRDEESGRSVKAIISASENQKLESQPQPSHMTGDNPAFEDDDDETKHANDIKVNKLDPSYLELFDKGQTQDSSRSGTGSNSQSLSGKTESGGQAINKDNITLVTDQPKGNNELEDDTDADKPTDATINKLDPSLMGLFLEGDNQQSSSGIDVNKLDQSQIDPFLSKGKQTKSSTINVNKLNPSYMAPFLQNENIDHGVSRASGKRRSGKNSQPTSGTNTGTNLASSKSENVQPEKAKMKEVTLVEGSPKGKDQQKAKTKESDKATPQSSHSRSTSKGDPHVKAKDDTKSSHKGRSGEIFDEPMTVARSSLKSAQNTTLPYATAESQGSSMRPGATKTNQGRPKHEQTGKIIDEPMTAEIYSPKAAPNIDFGRYRAGISCSPDNVGQKPELADSKDTSATLNKTPQTRNKEVPETAENYSLSAAPNVDSIKNKTGSGDTDNKRGSGDTDNKTGSGDTDNKPGSGDMDNKTGSGDTDNKTGSGDTDNKTGSGDMENKTGSGDMKKKPGSGDMDNKTGSGDTDNKTGSGDMKNKTKKADAKDSLKDLKAETGYVHEEPMAAEMYSPKATSNVDVSVKNTRHIPTSDSTGTRSFDTSLNVRPNLICEEPMTPKATPNKDVVKCKPGTLSTSETIKNTTEPVEAKDMSFSLNEEILKSESDMDSDRNKARKSSTSDNAGNMPELVDADKLTETPKTTHDKPMVAEPYFPKKAQSGNFGKPRAPDNRQNKAELDDTEETSITSTERPDHIYEEPITVETISLKATPTMEFDKIKSGNLPATDHKESTLKAVDDKDVAINLNEKAKKDYGESVAAESVLKSKLTMDPGKNEIGTSGNRESKMKQPDAKDTPINLKGRPREVYEEPMTAETYSLRATPNKDFNQKETETRGHALKPINTKNTSIQITPEPASLMSVPNTECNEKYEDESIGNTAVGNVFESRPDRKTSDNEPEEMYDKAPASSAETAEARTGDSGKEYVREASKSHSLKTTPNGKGQLKTTGSTVTADKEHFMKQDDTEQVTNLSKHPEEIHEEPVTSHKRSVKSTPGFISKSPKAEQLNQGNGDNAYNSDETKDRAIHTLKGPEQVCVISPTFDTNENTPLSNLPHDQATDLDARRGKNQTEPILSKNICVKSSPPINTNNEETRQFSALDHREKLHKADDPRNVSVHLQGKPKEIQVVPDAPQTMLLRPAESNTPEDVNTQVSISANDAKVRPLTDDERLGKPPVPDVEGIYQPTSQNDSLNSIQDEEITAIFSEAPSTGESDTTLKQVDPKESATYLMRRPEYLHEQPLGLESTELKPVLKSGKEETSIRELNTAEVNLKTFDQPENKSINLIEKRDGNNCSSMTSQIASVPSTENRPRDSDTTSSPQTNMEKPGETFKQDPLVGKQIYLIERSPEVPEIEPVHLIERTHPDPDEEPAHLAGNREVQEIEPVNLIRQKQEYTEGKPIHLVERSQEFSECKKVHLDGTGTELLEEVENAKICMSDNAQKEPSTYSLENKSKTITLIEHHPEVEVPVLSEDSLEQPVDPKVNLLFPGEDNQATIHGTSNNFAEEYQVPLTFHEGMTPAPETYTVSDSNEEYAGIDEIEMPRDQTESIQSIEMSSEEDSAYSSSSKENPMMTISRTRMAMKNMRAPDRKLKSANTTQTKPFSFQESRRRSVKGDDKQNPSKGIADGGKTKGKIPSDRERNKAGTTERNKPTEVQKKLLHKPPPGTKTESERKILVPDLKSTTAKKGTSKTTTVQPFSFQTRSRSSGKQASETPSADKTVVKGNSKNVDQRVTVQSKKKTNKSIPEKDTDTKRSGQSSIKSSKVKDSSSSRLRVKDDEKEIQSQRGPRRQLPRRKSSASDRTDGGSDDTDKTSLSEDDDSGQRRSSQERKSTLKKKKSLRSVLKLTDPTCVIEDINVNDDDVAKDSKEYETSVKRKKSLRSVLKLTDPSCVIEDINVNDAELDKDSTPSKTSVKRKKSLRSVLKLTDPRCIIDDGNVYDGDPATNEDQKDRTPPRVRFADQMDKSDNSDTEPCNAGSNEQRLTKEEFSLHCSNPPNSHNVAEFKANASPGKMGVTTYVEMEEENPTISARKSIPTQSENVEQATRTVEAYTLQPVSNKKGTGPAMHMDSAEANVTVKPEGGNTMKSASTDHATRTLESYTLQSGAKKQTGPTMYMDTADANVTVKPEKGNTMKSASTDQVTRTLESYTLQSRPNLKPTGPAMFMDSAEASTTVKPNSKEPCFSEDEDSKTGAASSEQTTRTLEAYTLKSRSNQKPTGPAMFMGTGETNATVRSPTKESLNTQHSFSDDEGSSGNEAASEMSYITMGDSQIPVPDDDDSVTSTDTEGPEVLRIEKTQAVPEKALVKQRRGLWIPYEDTDHGQSVASPRGLPTVSRNKREGELHVLNFKKIDDKPGTKKVEETEERRSVVSSRDLPTLAKHQREGEVHTLNFKKAEGNRSKKFDGKRNEETEQRHSLTGPSYLPTISSNTGKDTSDPKSIATGSDVKRPNAREATDREEYFVLGDSRDESDDGNSSSRETTDREEYCIPVAEREKLRIKRLWSIGYKGSKGRSTKPTMASVVSEIEEQRRLNHVDLDTTPTGPLEPIVITGRTVRELVHGFEEIKQGPRK